LKPNAGKGRGKAETKRGRSRASPSFFTLDPSPPAAPGTISTNEAYEFSLFTDSENA
jgi:hypothetical protein